MLNFWHMPMVTNFPATIDTTSNLPTLIDGITPLSGSVVNRLRDAIIAIETELGIKPSGIYATVKSRLDAIESAISGSGGIPLAGDLGGSVALPMVIGLQGRPVASTAPTVNQVLSWNGVSWSPSNSTFFPNGDLSGNSGSQTVIGLQGRPLISSAPTTGQTVIWNGTDWGPSNNFGSQLISCGGINSGPVVATSTTVGLSTLTGKFLVNAIPTSSTVSDTGQGIIYFDQTSGKFQVSENGAAYVDMIPPVPQNQVTTVSMNYGALSTDFVIACSIGGITITLPISPTNGQSFIIKDTNGNANASNITISATGGHNIDGSSNFIIGTNFGSVTVLWTGSQWSIV
jgi:hypothetical protein